MTQIVNGIHLPDHDKHFAVQIRMNPIIEGKGTYQYDKYRNALDLMTHRPTRVAIDIGAHVGLWTRLLAMDFDRVKAIEPIQSNVICLTQNVTSSGNLDVFMCAVSPHIGKLSLKLPDDIATASVCNYEDGNIEILCKPLDNFGFEDVDFIKIDVEGYENNVIKSGEFTIRKYRPVIVVEQKKRAVKYDGYKFAGIKTLASWGMDIAWENHGDYCMAWK